MAKKRKQFDRQKYNNHILIGSWFSWSCVDPLGDHPEIFNTNHGHTNKLKEVIMTRNLKTLYGITERRALAWMVDLTVEFKHNGRPYYREAQIGIHGILSSADAEGVYQQTIEEIFEKANMHHYVCVHIKAVVVGINPITDNDFRISAEG